MAQAEAGIPSERGTFERLDVTNESDWELLVNRVVERCGRKASATGPGLMRNPRTITFGVNRSSVRRENRG